MPSFFSWWKTFFLMEIMYKHNMVQGSCAGLFFIWLLLADDNCA